MGIGGSIFLIALGLILALAVNYQLVGIDINLIGWILVAVGVLGLALTLYFWNSRRRPTGAGTVEERRVYDDRPPL